MQPPEPSPAEYPYHPSPGSVGSSPRLGPALGWAVTLWILAGLALLAMLLCVGLSAYGFWIANHMEENGVTTSALVTNVAEDGDVTVEFTADGGQVTETITWLSLDDVEVGETIDVTYDPNDVTYVLRAGSNEDRAFAIGFAVAAGACLLVASLLTLGAVLVHRARTRNAKAADSTALAYGAGSAPEHQA